MTDSASQQTAARRVERLSNGEYLVIQPLDDWHEAKCKNDLLSCTPMAPRVNWSLIAVRTCLMIMALLVFYRLLQLSKIIS